MNQLKNSKFLLLRSWSIGGSSYSSLSDLFLSFILCNISSNSSDAIAPKMVLRYRLRINLKYVTRPLQNFNFFGAVFAELHFICLFVYFVISALGAPSLALSSFSFLSSVTSETNSTLIIDASVACLIASSSRPSSLAIMAKLRCAVTKLGSILAAFSNNARASSNLLACCHSTS